MSIFAAHCQSVSREPCFAADCQSVSIESHALHAVLPMAMQSVSIAREPCCTAHSQSVSKEPVSVMHAMMVEPHDLAC